MRRYPLYGNVIVDSSNSTALGGTLTISNSCNTSLLNNRASIAFAVADISYGAIKKGLFSNNVDTADARITAIVDTVSPTVGTGLSISVSPNHANPPVEALRVQSNGNVGIGTQTPQFTLDVNGNVRSSDIRIDNGNIHIGQNAGLTNQGQSAVAIGSGAGQTNQGPNSIAIGLNSDGIGTSSVAIGYNATTSTYNSAVALGTGATSTANNSFVVSNVRTIAPVSANNTLPLLYNTTTKEVQYNNTTNLIFSDSMSGNSNMYNRLILVSGAAGVYSVPTAVVSFPATITIRNTDATAKSLTSLWGTFIQNYIVSSASYALVEYQTVTIQSNGTNWEVLNTGPIDVQTIDYNYTTAPTLSPTHIGYTYSISVATTALPQTPLFAGISSYSPSTSYGNQTIGIGVWLVHFSVNVYWSAAGAGMVLAAIGDGTTKDLYGRFGGYQVQNTTSSVSGTSVISLTASTNINLWLMSQSAASGGSPNSNSFFKITRIA